jgi:hypothetical protein
MLSRLFAVLVFQEVPKPDAPSWLGKYSWIYYATFGALFGAAAAVAFLLHIRKLLRDGKSYREGQIKLRIDQAVKESKEESIKALQAKSEAESRLAACREYQQRVDEKANEVAKVNAQLIGEVEDIMRLVNRGCPHCHRDVFTPVKR